MKLLTLSSGRDFEQTSNTGFIEAEGDVENKLYFSKKSYINEYTKRADLFSWNGSKFRMKKTQIYHKSSFIDMKYDLEFDLTIEDAFKVEITTNLVSIHIMTNSDVFKYQSISFVIDGVIKNFYYAGTVVTEYAGVKEFHITREKSIDFHKSDSAEYMYITLTFNLPMSFETFSVLWMNYVDPNMKMIVDFDTEVIPQIKYGGISYIVPKEKAKHLLNINYFPEYYQIPESYYNINLTYGFRRYSNWKTLVFVIHEHFPSTNQISVKNISLELRTVGNVINAIKRGNENILSLGSIYIYDKDFAIHYENHPWFPGFHNYAVYNYTGRLGLIGESPNPEFISYTAHDDNFPSNMYTLGNSNSDNTTTNTTNGNASTESATVGTSTSENGTNTGGGNSNTGDGNVENSTQEILPSSYSNGDIVLNNMSFPWELLMLLYDYDEYTFDTHLMFDEYYWKYAILDQMKIINGDYDIIKTGTVNMGNYIIMPEEPIEYPLILFTKYRGYYRSTDNSRLTQSSNSNNSLTTSTSNDNSRLIPTTLINVDTVTNYFDLRVRNTYINIDTTRVSPGWIYPDGSINYLIHKNSIINLNSNILKRISNKITSEINVKNAPYDLIRKNTNIELKNDHSSKITSIIQNRLLLLNNIRYTIHATKTTNILLDDHITYILNSSNTTELKFTTSLTKLDSDN